MAPPAVAAVVAARVEAIEAVEARGERLAAGPGDEVVVSRHQAKGIHAPLEALHDLLEQRQKAEPVGIVAVDGDVARTARDDMEHTLLGKRDRPWNAGHRPHRTAAGSAGTGTVDRSSSSCSEGHASARQLQGTVP